MGLRRFLSLGMLSLAVFGCEDSFTIPGEPLVVQSVTTGQADAVQGEAGIGLTVRVSNPSAFAQRVESVTFTVSVAGSDRTADYALAPVTAIPAEIAPGGFVDLSWTAGVSASATPGVATIDAVAANAGGRDSLPAEDPGELLVLRHAELAILDSSVDGATCRDSRVATLSVRVRNDGESDALLGSVGAVVRRDAADVSAEFLVTPSASNALSIAPAEEVDLLVEIGSDGTTLVGPVQVVPAVTATDARSGVDAAPPDPQPVALDVHDRAVLSVPTVTENRVTVSKGQTALVVGVTVANSGTVPATLGAGTLSFLLGATPADGDYTVTPPAAGAVVAAGGMTVQDFTVAVIPSATSGATTIGGAFSATDAVCEEAPATSPAASAGAWIVQTPAMLQASSSAASGTLYAGEATAVTVTVSNVGEATATAVTPALALAGCATCGSLAPVNTNATNIAGGAAAMFTYTWNAANPTAATVQNVTFSASAAGTEGNTGGAAGTTPGANGGSSVHATLPTACFTISPQTGRFNSTPFTFDGSCSSDVETPTASLVYEWEVTGGTSFNDATGMVVTRDTGDPCNVCCDPPTCSDNTCCPGFAVWRIGLRVTDANGRTGYAEKLLPTVDSTFDVGCVTTLMDEDDAGATPGNPINTGFSLREAINWANTDTDSNAVCFDGALGTPATLTFASALPPLVDDQTHLVGRPGVTLDFTGLSRGIDVSPTGDEATISGLSLTGVTVSAASNNAKIVVADRAVIIYGNRIFGGTQGDGIVVTEEDNVVIEHNVIEMNPGRGVFLPRSASTDNSDPEVRRNVIRNNGGHGVETSAATDRTADQGPVIVLNVISANGGDGVHVGPGIIDTDVHHNTIYGNSGSGVELAACGFAPCNAQDFDVGNNILVSNGDCGGRSALGAGQWNTDGPSLLFGNTGAAYCGSITPAGGDLFTMDPLFTDAAGGNFRLRPLSPARNAGTIGFPVDMNDLAPGTFYGAGAEIGALETPP